MEPHGFFVPYCLKIYLKNRRVCVILLIPISFFAGMILKPYERWTI